MAVCKAHCKGKAAIRELRETVRVEAKTTGLDAYGREADPWASPTVIRQRVACAITPLVMRELLRAQAVNNPTTHKILMRFWKGLKPEHRFRFDKNGETRYLYLNGIINVGERNEVWEIMATENVAR